MRNTCLLKTHVGLLDGWQNIKRWTLFKSIHVALSDVFSLIILLKNKKINKKHAYI